MRYDPRSPYARASVWIDDADNDDLVILTLHAARIGARSLNLNLSRKGAPPMSYAIGRRVQYVRERGDQLARLPWRTLEDGRGDCKSLAALTASICASCGCRTFLRFVEYPGADYFGHVYTIADGIAIDPELPYDTEVMAGRVLDVRI